MKHPIFDSDHSWYGSGKEGPHYTKAKLYLKNKATPEEYVNLLSGAYGISPDEAAELIADSQTRHNTPENNSRAILEHYRQAEANDEEPNRYIRSVPEHLPINEEAVLKLHKMGHGPYLENKNIPITPDIIDAYATDHDGLKDIAKKRTEDYRKHHKQINNYLPVSKLMDLKEKRPDLDDILTYENIKRGAEPKDLKDLLRIAPDEDKEKIINDNLDSRDFTLGYSTIQKLPRELKNKYVDAKLGITGGKIDDPDDDHWGDNFTHGPGYDRKHAADIATDHDLEPYQAEHIKRFGSHDEKVGMFFNPSAKAHADEMYHKWTENDFHHNYDENDFRQSLIDRAEENDDYHNFYEEARDKVQERYPFEKYLDNNYDWDDQKESWINNHLAENYDWTDGDDDHSDDFSDHPEYDDRRSKAEDAWDNLSLSDRLDTLDDGDRDNLYENYDDYLRDDVDSEIDDLKSERNEGIHENPEHLPRHLSALDQIKAKVLAEKRDSDRQEALAKEKHLGIDQKLPKKSNETFHAPGLNQAKLLRDHAEANGGQIDIGSMNKKYPGLKENWKNIFKDKGKMSTADIDAHIESLPKTKFHVTHGLWDKGNTQNSTDSDQIVFRLDHSPESMAPIESDPEKLSLFNKIASISQRSGHPTNANTIGWARVDTSNPNHWFVDELQTDYGKGLREFLSENNKEEEAKKADEILSHQAHWGEALMNHIVDQAKAHGVSKISMHTPESKTSVTGADKVHSVYKDSYHKIPKALGFQPGSHTEVPDSTQRHFIRGSDNLETARKAHAFHTGMANQTAQAIVRLRQVHGESDRANEIADRLQEKIDYHNATAENVLGKIKAVQPDFDPQAKEHQNRLSWTDIPEHAEISNDYLKPPEVHEGAKIDLTPKDNAILAPHTFNLTQEPMKKSELDEESKNKISQIILKVDQVKDKLKDAKDPAIQALLDMTERLREFYTQLTGEEPKITQDSPHEEQETEQVQQESQGPHLGHLATKAQRITHGQRVYTPGTIRQDNPQHARIKEADGSWHSLSGQPKEAE